MIDIGRKAMTLAQLRMLAREIGVEVEEYMPRSKLEAKVKAALARNARLAAKEAPSATA